ncbi:DUF6916 family protein [Primorskyibacter sp. 2E233]|uniref:DUF6916 family protein n=1 Tax=Primorskyibacter sp. 2E233 TaxID=3413431 RepID=UPI003BF2EFE8
MIDTADLSPQDFQSLVGKTFLVSVPAGQVALKLDNVKTLSEATKRDTHVEIDGRVLPPRRAFALVLEGPFEPLLPQKIYQVEVPELGQAELFIVPFRQEQGLTLYEIGFS